MIVIPAVDLRQGACVQLVGGSVAHERLRLDDPIGIARTWTRWGFTRLHVVDVDAALTLGSNAHLIEELLDHRLGDVQVGGGVRTTDRVEAILDAGAARVVLGTRALEDEDWLADVANDHPGEIVVAVDARGRRVVTHGWSRTLARDVVDVVEELSQLPLAGVLVTAVERDGRLTGADLPLMEDVVEVAPFPVIAAGGVTGVHDLRALQARGVSATVVGMALYTGALDPARVAQEFAE